MIILKPNLLVGLLAVFCLASVAFAFSAWGGFGGNSHDAKNVSVSVRAQFLKAVYEGDYDAAKTLSEEYGLGGRFLRNANETTFSEMASLRKQISNAISTGDYEKAVELRDQMQEQAMASVRDHLNESFKERAGMKYGQAGGSMGFRSFRYHPTTTVH